MSSAYEKQRKFYEALQRTVASLADTLEKAMPDLPEPSSVTRTGDGCITILTGRVSWQAQAHTLHESLQQSSADIHDTRLGCFCAWDFCHDPSGPQWQLVAVAWGCTCVQEIDDSAATGPFEDEDTRAFYESMPDLRAVVPAVLLGEAAPADTSDRNASSLNVDITPPSEAAVSENGDADPGEIPCHFCAVSVIPCKLCLL